MAVTGPAEARREEIPLFLVIQAYDVLDTLHVRCIVTDDRDDQALVTILKRTAELPLPRVIEGNDRGRELLAAVAEEALNLAYLPGANTGYTD